MKTYRADFHIHIGRALGRPVKIAAGSSLTLDAVLHHALYVKGLDVITIIDGVCDHVLTEVQAMMDTGELTPVSGGGLLYRDRLLVILGSEIELAGPVRGAAHFGCWFPSLQSAADFNGWLKTVQKNTTLSSQRAHTEIETLLHETRERNGLFIVHHAFTPFKGLLGSCVDKLSLFMNPTDVDALELGLSSDTDMADRLSELERMTFLSNSDAHGLDNVAREYNDIQLERPSFVEIEKVLRRLDNRCVVANYGLHPQHGKYFRSRCRKCDVLISVGTCDCGSTKGHVHGVWDRLLDIADLPQAVHPTHRPPYYHHVPLRDIPGVGKRAHAILLDAFGTELDVSRTATDGELVELLGEKLGTNVANALKGNVAWKVGGAGTYGKLLI